MKMLFIGGYFTKEMEPEILRKTISGSVQYAANKLQKNMIEGFSTLDEIDLEVLSAPFVGTFPLEYKDIYYRRKRGSVEKNTDFKFVPFVNLWGLRNISRKINLSKAVSGFVTSTNECKTIIVYSPHNPFLQAAVYAKRKDPSIHICLIVPDLPHFMNLNDKHTIFYKYLKKIDVKILYKNLEFVDSFVLLTKQMKDVLNVGRKSFVVVEGICDVNEGRHNSEEFKESKCKTVVYTGTLNKKFGVVNLVKAFHKLGISDISLKICGRGDSEEIIKKFASEDDRIEYLGQLSNEDSIKLQKEATVLVNPRQNDGEYTKYSFPSKNIEYLITGNPVITYKLDGIPDDYDDYFYYVEDDSIESLTKKLKYVLQLPKEERIRFGLKGKSFVLSEKNAHITCGKIVTMINQNMDRGR